MKRQDENSGRIRYEKCERICQKLLVLLLGTCYLELERQFLETKRYIEFSENNSKAYSVEYLKLYQAICSEIDTVGKEIAADVVSGFVVDTNTNIKRWGYNLQKVFGNIKDDAVIFYDTYTVKPFENWVYEEYDKKLPNGKMGKDLRIVGQKKTIIWWRNYNDIKHQRIGLVSGKKNFQIANQKNVVLSLAALFLLEWRYLNYINTGGDSIEPSQLFSVVN